MIDCFSSRSLSFFMELGSKAEASHFKSSQAKDLAFAMLGGREKNLCMFNVLDVEVNVSKHFFKNMALNC